MIQNDGKQDVFQQLQDGFMRVLNHDPLGGAHTE